MILFVGIGNVGTKYENTRHNIGFMLIDAIARSSNFAVTNSYSKFNATVISGLIGGKKIILLKPHTYVNNSGISVLSCKTFYKIDNSDVVVAHDDVALKIGTVKMKNGGGSAGHNGIKSIDSTVGKDYWRLRIGIESERLHDNLAGFVLDRFADSELDIVNRQNEEIANSLEVILSKDINKFSLLQEKLKKISTAIVPVS